MPSRPLPEGRKTGVVPPGPLSQLRGPGKLPDVPVPGQAEAWELTPMLHFALNGSKLLSAQPRASVTG